MLGMRPLSACCLVLAWLPACFSVFEVQKMGLRVIFPVKGRATFDMALANFGEPKYGASMMGQIVYPSSDPVYNRVSYQCNPVPCEYVCSPLNESKPAFAINKEPGKNHIMLIDRGPRKEGIVKPCTFLEKVYYAQIAGADAVIYVNDKDGGLLTPDTPEDADLSKLLAIVNIPAGFVSLTDGTTLKALLKSGPVTVALNWTDILPRAPQVSWEFWTNSNDECGEICNSQQRFVKEMKLTAKALQQGSLASFSPHYLVWSCPDEFDGSDACDTQCIRNGTYCCPDPDDDIKKGYSGADVLWMNLRSLCFFRVANMSGQPWLWWDYVDKVGQECSMEDMKFGPTCSEQVFAELGGHKLLGGKAKEEWHKCVGQDDQVQGNIQMLEDELAAQHGDQDGASSVAILPTIRINGAQYRGSLSAAAVTRALCSAFPLNKEPDVCNNEAVSENECMPGGVGYISCRNGTNTAQGKTDCVNTFNGYECRCGQGYVRLTKPDTNQEYCADVNECLVTNEPARMADCSCERCTCINEKGGFRCSGHVDNVCTAEMKFGGCWHQTIGKIMHHACVDMWSEYRGDALRGTLTAASKSFKCQCPACFDQQPDGSCVPKCALEKCNPQTGVCSRRKLPSGSSSGGSRSGSGVGALGVFFIVLVSMVATAGAMYGVYHYHLKRKFRDDMRDLMLEYMPLSAADTAPAPVRGISIQA